MGKQWKQWDTIFLGSKISADGDRSHEIKRSLLLGWKSMTNLYSILKSRDILPAKRHIVKAMVFPIDMYKCGSWTIRKAEHQRIDVSELWHWRRLLRVLWTARRSSQWCHPGISPLSSPSPPAPNPSQHQGLFQWVNSLHEVAKVLEFQLQHHSFQRNPRPDLLQNGLVGSPCSPRDSQESSPTPQFKRIDSLVLSILYGPALTSVHD